MVTEAVLDLLGSAAAVAVTNTCAGLGRAAGAVYSPVDVIVPQEAPEHPGPVSFHETL